MPGDSISSEDSNVVALVNNGASLADSVFSGSADVNTTYKADALPFSLPVGDYHTLGDLVFSGTFASALAASKYLPVYRRDLNIKGANSAAIPTATNKSTLVGHIKLSTGTTQYIKLPAISLSKECEFYIENDSGQTLNIGWTLDLIVFGYNQQA